MMNHGSGRYVDHRTGRGLRGGDRRGRPPGRPHPAPSAPAGASEILRAGEAGGRLQPDQPPHDLPQRGARLRQPLPRLLVELSGRADRLLERRRDRGGHRPRPAIGGQGPNPFTVTAIDFWEQRLAQGFQDRGARGERLPRRGRRPTGPTSSPIGEGATAVRAEELSEPGIECGVEAGHTYAKVTGAAGPDVRMEARPPGFRGAPATFGDTVRAGSAAFSVQGHGRRRAHAAGDQGRQTLQHGAGRRRLVPVRLHRLGPGPLPPAGAARADDRDGVQPDLPRARARAP